MEGKKIALEKAWNILLAVLIGEVSTAFHYGKEKAGWLIAGMIAIAFLGIAIAYLTLKLDREKE